MKSNKISSALLVTAATCGAIASTTIARAAENEKAIQRVELETVAVTAQRDTQNLQEVPIAVTALSATTLDNLGVTGTQDLAAVVPGLVLTKSTFTVQPFLRGVGNPSVVPGSDPSVATYVDGIYQSSANGGLFSFNNIERIEVLKGPQGTLFGRNATGGLIQIITKDPSRTPAAKINVGYGNYDTWQTSAYVTGGIDIVAADLAIIYNKQNEGWGRNAFTPSQGTASGTGTIVVGGVPVAIPSVPRDMGTSEEKGARTKVVIDPTDKLTMTLGAHYLKTESDQGLYRHPLYGSKQSSGFLYTGGFYDANVNTPFSSENKQMGADADIEFDMGFATLKSITAYQHADSINIVQSTDVPLVDAFAGTAQAEVVTKSTSEELQLLSNSDSDLQWLGGLYYSLADSGYLDLPFVRGNFLQGGTTRHAPIHTDSKSVFGQATYSFGDGNSLTLGGRYTQDKIRTSQYYIGSDSTATNPAAVSFPGNYSSVVDEQSVTQSKFTYRVAFDHHFTEEVMGYVSLNTGFKSGGFNAGSMCLSGALGYCPAADIPSAVKPEILKAVEMGLKTELFDRRLRLNSSVFGYKYEDLQVQTLIPNAQGQQVAQLKNAGKATIYGADFDWQALITNNLTITGGLSLLHTKFDSFEAATAPFPLAAGGAATLTFDATGNKLPRAPTATLNLGINYTIPTAIGDLDLNSSLYHSSSFYWEVSNRVKQDPYNTVNVGAVLALKDSPLKLKAYGRNIFGKEYYSFVSVSNFGDQGAPAAPRTYGVAVEMNF